MNTRQHIQTQSKFLPVQTRTNRFKNSVVPYLTGIQYEVSSNYSETLLALWPVDYSQIMCIIEPIINMLIFVMIVQRPPHCSMGDRVNHWLPGRPDPSSGTHGRSEPSSFPWLEWSSFNWLDRNWIGVDPITSSLTKFEVEVFRTKFNSSQLSWSHKSRQHNFKQHIAKLSFGRLVKPNWVSLISDYYQPHQPLPPTPIHQPTHPGKIEIQLEIDHKEGYFG